MPIASDKDWAPFPTYPVVLQFKGDDQEINDFKKRIAGSPTPGLPKFDPNRGVRISLVVMRLYRANMRMSPLGPWEPVHRGPQAPPRC